jgi:epoxyqueuosine reductase
VILKLTGIVDDKANWIENIIKRFVDESPENTLRNKENERAWAEPLVGFSSGADPLYQFYKKHIGEFYFTPLELFVKTFPKAKVTADQLTVVSWILPHTETTKKEHRKETRFPTDRWARARIYGEEFNDKLRKYVVATLTKEGHRAVAPALSQLWGTRPSKKYHVVSNWSERHAAYAAGLGTFGLCDGLITKKGKAMRCGSVIAEVDIAPSERPYTDHHAYCLFYSKGTCGKCIERCPAGAISKAGHDKRKCGDYLDMTRGYVETNFRFKGYGCGLCQTGVPCESEVPTVIRTD